MTALLLHHRRLGRWTMLVLLLSTVTCGGTPTTPPANDEPEPPGPVPEASLELLSGKWSVRAERVLADGTIEVRTGSSSVSARLGGNALKETLLLAGADGSVIEMQSLIIPRGGDRWTIARGDASRGTFDIVTGAVADAAGTLTSRDSDRPDGGMTRLRFSELSTDAFTVEREESSDSGANWTLATRYAYDRGESPAPTGPRQSVCDDPFHHTFDFWLGSWDATGANGLAAGSNDIRRRLGGCILEENWDGGTQGISFNMYDVRTALWYQTWVSSAGVVLILQGTAIPGRVVMEGISGGAGQRVTWTSLPGGQVRQRGESESSPGTWAVSYDLVYSKR